MGIAVKRRRTPGEFAFDLGLDAAIRTLIATVDAVRFVRKMRRRYQARRKR
jgi:hypothetical protein